MGPAFWLIVFLFLSPLGIVVQVVVEEKNIHRRTFLAEMEQTILRKKGVKPDGSFYYSGTSECARSFSLGGRCLCRFCGE